MFNNIFRVEFSGLKKGMWAKKKYLNGLKKLNGFFLKILRSTKVNKLLFSFLEINFNL